MLIEQMAEDSSSRLKICQILNHSRSTTYAQKKKSSRPRRIADQSLTMKITTAFSFSRATYGAPRLRAALRDQGVRCGKSRISRLMKQAGLSPRQKRKFSPTTTQSDPRHHRRIAPNWPAEIPEPDAINQLWQADITYIRTAEGWLYLAGIIDRHSRKIIGTATSESFATNLVTAAWQETLTSRRPPPGLIHHSDRGCQYTRQEFTDLLKSNRVTSSMSRRGNCYDNAHTESFWSTLKTECFGSELPKTRQQAKRMIFDYIYTFYNTTRKHSSLGMLSPNEFEKNLLKGTSGKP
mgnify:CR=1 FL=1